MGNNYFWTLVVVLILIGVYYQFVFKPRRKRKEALAKAKAIPIKPVRRLRAEDHDYSAMRPDVIRAGETAGENAMRLQRARHEAAQKEQQVEATAEDLRVRPNDPETAQARHELGVKNRALPRGVRHFDSVSHSDPRPYAPEPEINAAGLLGVLAVGAVLGAEPSIQAIEDLTEGKGYGKAEETPQVPETPDAGDDSSDNDGGVGTLLPTDNGL